MVREVAQEEALMEDVSEGEEEAVREVEVVRNNGNDATAEEDMSYVAAAEDVAATMEDTETEPTTSNATVESADESDEDDPEDFDQDEDDDSSEEDQDDSSPDEEDGVPNTGLPRLLYHSAFSRRQSRDKVARAVPCSSHTRVYRGHCNVKTVKDVNYLGLEDEYVVSGSDDGNLFIWDRKTSELVNVLEGDGEVVNVVQGHPYECLLAVSGIDHTVKIFSPDQRAREAARLGRGVGAADSENFSSLAWPPRMGRRVRRQGGTSEPAVPRREQMDVEEEEDDDYVAPGGLASRRRMHESYRIMQQNDLERQGGNQDAFITVSQIPESLLRMLLMGRMGL